MLVVRLQYPELVYIGYIKPQEKANYSEKEKVLINIRKLILYNYFEEKYQIHRIVCGLETAVLHWLQLI